MLKQSKLSNFHGFWAFQFLMTIPKKSGDFDHNFKQPKESTYFRRLKIQVYACMDGWMDGCWYIIFNFSLFKRRHYMPLERHPLRWGFVLI
jgi:hypothetical protein